MIPRAQLNKRAKMLYDDIKSARIYIDDKVSNGNIIKKTIDKNTIKVFINMTDQSGIVNRVEIFDTDGEIVQFQNMNFVKDRRYGYLAVVEIKLTNEEVYNE